MQTRSNFMKIAALSLLAIALMTRFAPAQDEPQPPQPEAKPNPIEQFFKEGAGNVTTVRFSFDGTPWRDVIKWLAEEADLALHINNLPTGSFTYTDDSRFTHEEAIARVNLFLLPEGYTLVRSGRLLSVIDLGDPRSMKQLDALAKLVSVDDLDKKEKYDVVKCIFPLGELESEEAVQELSALNLMTTPAVFEKTNQLMITDTVSKLQSVKQIIDSFQPDTLDNGTVVANFPLKHIDAEDALTVIRPHLGLATGEMIGIDVSLSADLQGKNIFVTGVDDKVKLIRGLIESIDIADDDVSINDANMVLKNYIVPGGNVQTVYNVLVTLLATKTVRISMDEASESIVVLTDAETQKEVAMTVEQLQAAGAEFEAIPLKSVDPYFAISLLEEMLDLPDPLLSDDDENSKDYPKIDADPGNMRLFVRAKRHQIDQIKKIIEGLDVSTGVAPGETMRLLPLRGSQAETILQTAAKFWREPNPIMFFPSTEVPKNETAERIPAGEEETPVQAKPAAPSETGSQAPRMLTTFTESQAPMIRCQMTPRGLLIQCDDDKALDKFENHLRAVAGPVESVPSDPVVFYLKYTRAEQALQMLAELIDGGETANIAAAGTLVNGDVSSSSSGGLFSSLITSRDGMLTLLGDTMTIVADTRLNRLIAQGTTTDIETIERYLKIVDKDNSITSIETYGRSHVIELQNTKATEVAAAIREAFAGRISAGGSQQSGQSGRGGDQAAAIAAAKAAAEAKREGGEKKNAAQKKTATQAARDLEPKMTLAIHEPSNSLIVTAPDLLFAEVEKLAMLIDSRSEQSIQVISPKSGAAFEAVLQQMLTGQGGSRRPSSTNRPSPPSGDRRPDSGGGKR